MKKVQFLGLLVCVLVLGAVTGCSSAPITRIFDQSVPEEQTATLFLPPGDGQYEVTHFQGRKLNPTWLMPNTKTGLLVKFPSVTVRTSDDPGDCSFGYKFYNSYITANGVINHVMSTAGRNYRFYGFRTSSSSTAKFYLFETPQKIEPKSNEQVLYIKDTGKYDVVVILNAGKTFELSGYEPLDDSRVFYLKGKEESRFIVPKGANSILIMGVVTTVNVFGTVVSTFSVVDMDKIEDDQIKTFTASEEPIRYSVVIQNGKLNLVKD